MAEVSLEAKVVNSGAQTEEVLAANESEERCSTTLIRSVCLEILVSFYMVYKSLI